MIAGFDSLESVPEDVLRRLGVDSENGLKQSEAEARLEESGPNSISESNEDSLLRVLFELVKEPMILILIIIGLIYLLIGTPIEAISVIVIVFIVIAIEVYNVRKARISIRALRSLFSPKAWILRGGATVQLPISHIVPGDVILLHAGERVPADGIILECIGLAVDESSLTGESIPVQKQSFGSIADGERPTESYMIMSGTLVVQGSGKFAVVSTGIRTELGKISASIKNEEETKTPLEISLNRTSRILIGIAVFFSFLVPLIGFLHGNPLDQMVLTGLSMAFATVPEELPILITITLAVGAYALSRRRAIVKDLRAAQTLGSVTVIATDKTGTLTENKMMVDHVIQGEEIYGSTAVPGERVLVAGILATGTLAMDTKGTDLFRDPMEISIFEYVKKAGLDFEKVRNEYLPVTEFAFDGSLKLASYIYKKGLGYEIFTSGAPEYVLERCTRFAAANGKETVLTEERKTSILRIFDSLARSGERTIGVAYAGYSEEIVNRDQAERDLVFLGLFSFLDPPRKGVKEAIEMCQDAGIRVMMLTGDHPGTASAIAKLVGITGYDNVLTGNELQTVREEDLEHLLRDHSVFARISHSQKLRIVRALQKSGHSVAVTGDGVNDAPALRAAEIGIAMGIRGTDVAKEASDMILEDDDFQTIVDAVFQGRKMQYTLRKGIKYYISVKFSLISILLIPLILIIPFPFVPLQIIVMELFMDVGAMWGFLYENDEVGMFFKHPSPNGSGFITREMTHSIIYGSAGIFLAVTFVYLYLYYSNGNVVQAQMGAFSTWILSQVILAQNLRTENQPVTQKGFLSNPIIFAWGIIVVGMLVVFTLYSPLHSILDTSSLRLQEWLIIVVAAILSSSWMEILKYSKYKDKILESGDKSSSISASRGQR